MLSFVKTTFGELMKRRNCDANLFALKAIKARTNSRDEAGRRLGTPQP
jgi:hypothetical protein